MHFAERAYFLIVATALLAIAGIWASEPGVTDLWRWPAAFLLAGLACEALLMRKIVIHADVATQARAVLGRQQSAAFSFRNESGRTLSLEFAPVMPEGIEPLPETRRVSVPARGSAADPFILVPLRLGQKSWPKMPLRCLGPLGLAWWSRELAVAKKISIAPDSLRISRARPRGRLTGLRGRRVVGAGSELYQLRAYAPGDSLARVDWKASARSGALVTREFSEDQHLDILIALDAGRFSRMRAGTLDRFGLYANIVARFAELATPNDDRVGLVVFAERPLAVWAPERGQRAIMRMHSTLAQFGAQASESDPVRAALAIRALLKHRSLIIWLTDLEDGAAAAPLARAVRLLAPPHLVVVAGVRSQEIQALADSEAAHWRDPWVALAAREQQERAAAQRLQLQRLGAPVIAANEDALQEAIFRQYETLRRRRRV